MAIREAIMVGAAGAAVGGSLAEVPAAGAEVVNHSAPHEQAHQAPKLDFATYAASQLVKHESEPSAQAADVAPNGSEYDPVALARNCVEDTLQDDIIPGLNFGNISPRGKTSLTGDDYLPPMWSGIPDVDCPPTSDGQPAGRKIEDRMLFEQARVVRIRRGHGRKPLLRLKLSKKPVTNWITQIEDNSQSTATPGHETHTTFEISPQNVYRSFPARVKRLLVRRARRHGASAAIPVEVGRRVFLQRRISAHSGDYSQTKTSRPTEVISLRTNQNAKL